MAKRRLKIKKAKHSGFCFGVKRAISVAEDFLRKNKHGYSLGPIIHNPGVVEELDKKGLQVISDIKQAKGSYILIRSHGISPSLRQKTDLLSIGMVDATCPFVKRSQNIVTSLKNEGYRIIIIGEKDHPEIMALSEIAGLNCLVVRKESDLKKINLTNDKVAVVAQTTLSRDDFLRLARIILGKKCFEYRVFDTICNDVLKRQTEAKELAKNVDAVLIVGGKISANTRHLAQVCKNMGTRTYHIENEKELKPSWLKDADSVGVISGASTPDKVVDKVVLKIKKFSGDVRHF